MAMVLDRETDASSTFLVEEPLYETVRGQRVELPPMGARPTHVASLLSRYLGPYCWAQQLGVVEVEMLFQLDNVERNQRRPDLAFISFDRWPRDRQVPDDPAWSVVPDLAVEVVSPTDRDEDGLDKVREYFEAGVRQVWKVYPRLRVIHVYETYTTIRVVAGLDALEGGAIVPGFRLPLSELFEDDRQPEARP